MDYLMILPLILLMSFLVESLFIKDPDKEKIIVFISFFYKCLPKVVDPLKIPFVRAFVLVY